MNPHTINKEKKLGTATVAAMVAGAGLTAIGEPAFATWMVTNVGVQVDVNNPTLDLNVDGAGGNDFGFSFISDFEGPYYDCAFADACGYAETSASLSSLNTGVLLNSGNNLTPTQIVNSYIIGGTPVGATSYKLIKNYNKYAESGGPGDLYDDFIQSGTVGLYFDGLFGYVSFTSFAGFGGELGDYVGPYGETGRVFVEKFGLWEADKPTPGVPEPGTLALLATGAAGIAAMRRRRRRQ